MEVDSSSIGECASRCLGLFSECIDAVQHVKGSHDGQAKNEIQDELVRFKLWASNIGVFADVQTSLDFRIRDFADVKELFLEQVEKIERRLGQLRDDINSRQLETEGASNERKDNVRTAGLITHRNSAKTDFMHWDADKLLQTIHESIGWLNRLSNSVRKASFSNQNKRAENFYLQDSEGKDSEELTKAMVAGLRKLFQQFIKQNSADLDDKLTRRLVETMVIRHKRILYRRSRQERWVIPKVEHGARPAGMLDESQQQPLLETLQEPKPPQADTQPTKERKAIPPRDIATTVDVASYRKPAPSRLSRASSTPLKQHEKMNIPPPPRVLSGSKEFVCPYCCLVLQCSEMSNTAAWVKHVKQDLDPYICLFEECNNPLEIYSSRKLWLSHMSTQHRMRWKCFATNHEPLAYITPQEFEDHMRNNHAGHFQEDELAFIVEISAHPITPTLEHCPFCSYTDGNFEEHVGQHLREFALRSLPWPDHEEKGSQHSSQCDSDSTSSAKSRETLNDTGEWLPLPIFDDVGDNDNDDAMEIEKESGNRLKLYGQFPKIAAQHEPLILESLNDETIEAFACNKYKVGNVKSLIRVLSGKTSKFERIRESNSWIDISKEPASLLKYLESRSELFSERIIRIMSLLIGYDVLHQNGISWFQRGLNSANVYFFQTADRKTPLRPFIQVNLPEPSEAISLRVDNENNYDADVDGFDGGHPCPALIDLAVVLIEIYFAKPFTKLAQIIGIPLKSSGRQIRLVDVDQVFNGCPENKADEWRLQIPEDSAFLKAIDNCLSPTMWMDEEGDPLDNTTLQVWIYEHVVQFLEIYLTAGFGNISLANIESYAKSLDLGQLGQIIDSYEP